MRPLIIAEPQAIESVYHKEKRKHHVVFVRSVKEKAPIIRGAKKMVNKDAIRAHLQTGREYSNHGLRGKKRTIISAEGRTVLKERHCHQMKDELTPINGLKEGSEGLIPSSFPNAIGIKSGIWQPRAREGGRKRQRPVSSRVARVFGTEAQAGGLHGELDARRKKKETHPHLTGAA